MDEKKIKEPENENIPAEVEQNAENNSSSSNRKWYKFPLTIKDKVVDVYDGYKQKVEEKISAVDLKNLPKPINDARTSGPKKMKNFAPWAKRKTAVVGIAGILAVIGIRALYAYITTDVLGKTSFVSSPWEVWESFITMVKNGYLWRHLSASLQRIMVGYAIALCLSIPIGFVMAWYKPFRAFLDPFIQFLRCIPPIAYLPVVVVALGNGESSKYFVIFLACFLTMTVTIFQGVKNIDLTLVKAAYTFGARDRNLFTGVIVPSAFPFILTAMRLGIGVAMTTLIAAELTGALYGLGSFIQTQGSNLRMDNTIMGIIVLGFFGILFDKVLLYVEKVLTRWK